MKSKNKFKVLIIFQVFRHLPVSASRSHPSLKRRGNFLWDDQCLNPFDHLFIKHQCIDLSPLLRGTAGAAGRGCIPPKFNISSLFSFYSSIVLSFCLSQSAVSGLRSSFIFNPDSFCRKNQALQRGNKKIPRQVIALCHIPPGAP